MTKDPIFTYTTAYIGISPLLLVQQKCSVMFCRDCISTSTVLVNTTVHTGRGHTNLRFFVKENIRRPCDFGINVRQILDRKSRRFSDSVVMVSKFYR